MVKQNAREWWPRFAEALARSGRTVNFAVRIPPTWLLSNARYWFEHWSGLTAASQTAADQLRPHKAMYRHKVVKVAYLELKEAQLQARVKLLAIVLGLLAAGSGWAWLSVIAYANSGWFVAISAILFLLNAVATAPAAAFTDNPWRRLGRLAVFWATLSVGLLAAAGWPNLDWWRQQPPDPLQIFAFATGSVALFCLLGTLLARLAFFVSDVLVDRRRSRRYPDISALLHTIEMIELLSQGDSLGELFSRRNLMWRLDYLVDCISVHIPRVLGVRGHGVPEVARARFDQAASALRDYQTQVALPNRDTRQRLSACMAEFAVPLVTGHYELLPASEAMAEPPSSLVRQPARLARGVLVAGLPLAIVIAYPMFGFSLPDYVRQWLAGFAVVWLIAKVLQLLDPLYDNTWDRVHTALNLPRPPSDKP